MMVLLGWPPAQGPASVLMEPISESPPPPTPGAGRPEIQFFPLVQNTQGPLVPLLPWGCGGAEAGTPGALGKCLLLAPSLLLP